MAKIVLDTSVYIPLLRQGRQPGSIIQTRGSTLYLSVVVAQELYAGAGDMRTQKALDRLFHVFKKNARLIVPREEEWIECGVVLAKIGKKYGFESVKKGRLVNDVLIALSCRQAGAVLLTANHKDFQIIHSFLKFQFMGV
ncbi:MAG: PIN domain-containing protein [Deltaproteobacteria bacterium]|nr:PIN domain-containing protein [Deltaproteobacteria bacterium]